MRERRTPENPLFYSATPTASSSSSSATTTRPSATTSDRSTCHHLGLQRHSVELPRLRSVHRQPIYREIPARRLQRLLFLPRQRVQYQSSPRILNRWGSGDRPVPQTASGIARQNERADNRPIVLLNRLGKLLNTQMSIEFGPALHRLTKMREVSTSRTML